MAGVLSLVRRPLDGHGLQNRPSSSRSRGPSLLGRNPGHSAQWSEQRHEKGLRIQ